MRGTAAMRAAAVLCVVGVDGTRLLTTSDPIEALMLHTLGDETLRLVQQRDKALAVEIANAMARSQRR